MGLVALASVGLAMTESTTEAYFFDILKGKEELRFYGPYNTTTSANHLVAKLIPSLFLLVLPFKFVFLFFGLMMFGFFLLSYKIRDVVEDGKK